MSEFSFDLVFLFTKTLRGNPGTRSLREQGRYHLFMVEVLPLSWSPTVSAPSMGTSGRALLRGQGIPRPPDSAKEAKMWASPFSSINRLSPGAICQFLGPRANTTHSSGPPPHFCTPGVGMQNRHRLQCTLKNIQSIFPWSWQEAGWEYAMERRGRPCQILQFPKSERDLVGAPELTAHREARRDGPVWEACPLGTWASSWGWTPLPGP